ncbi:YfcZ/YiiS family protein [Vibrio sp. ZSDE26]|uniref:YfcZ/YiiS family protein n=1 Tax=Vibrio amylolyticus TaxID=2847292 RepID=A0A9X1XQL6_9VIBR|nr:DUF406 family protein [Vibrio amylolyticus]MCK6263754.1 YfcZ/YiiS family protein [Vibrio amylolyticus]
MSTEKIENDVCEACGCAGEIGFIINEGDEVSEVTIHASDSVHLKAELDKYLTLANDVCKNVEIELPEITEASTEATARFKFEVSAEKVIFELKTRSLRR